MKCPHCASVLLLIQHSRREGSELPCATVASKARLHKIEHQQELRRPAMEALWAPARCASMRITKPNTQVQSRRGVATKGRSCRERRTKAVEAYLDGLRGLAFHLVRYGGGLIHVGTKSPPAHGDANSPSSLCSLLSDGESLFGVRLEARNRI